jgi:hypothetical protein
MPSFPFSQALTANQKGFNPLANAAWQYEFIRIPSRVTILVRATTNGVQETLYAGSDTVTERSPVQGGGVAGTTPSPLNTTPISWFAAIGDRLKLVFDETLGGTPTLDGTIEVQPLA